MTSESFFRGEAVKARLQKLLAKWSCKRWSKNMIRNEVEVGSETAKMDSRKKPLQGEARVNTLRNKWRKWSKGTKRTLPPLTLSIALCCSIAARAHFSFVHGVTSKSLHRQDMPTRYSRELWQCATNSTLGVNECQKTDVSYEKWALSDRPCVTANLEKLYFWLLSVPP